jgi:hypothetical protein
MPIRTGPPLSAMRRMLTVDPNHSERSTKAKRRTGSTIASSIPRRDPARHVKGADRTGHNDHKRAMGLAVDVPGADFQILGRIHEHRFADAMTAFQVFSTRD